MYHVGNRCILTTVLVSFFAVGGADHFYGAAIMWKPVRNQPLNISMIIRSAYKRSRYFCDDTTKANGAPLQSATIGCLDSSATCPQAFGSPISLTAICTDYSTSEDWSSGEGTMEVALKGQGPFTVKYKGSQWIQLVQVVGGHWSIPTTIDVSIRNDTGKPNSSPQTLFAPKLRIERGCGQTVPIPVTDPDNDTLRCRWGRGSEECGSICGPISGVYLDQEGCVLSFASFLPTGLYGIALIVEDFLDAESTQPLSKIAVQFIVTISNRPCSNIPQFSGNTSNHGDKLKAIPGETWQTLITIHSSAYSIREVLTIGPKGLAKSDITALAPSDYQVTLFWTPTSDQVGENPMCFYASNTLGVQAILRCIIITVEDTSPPEVHFINKPDFTITGDINITWSCNEHCQTTCELLYPNGVNTSMTMCGLQWQGIDLDVEGTYTLSVIAEDEAGNIAQAINHTFIADYSPPELTFINNPSFTSWTVDVTWTYNEPANETCEMNVPGSYEKHHTTCNRTWIGRNMTLGYYTLYITSIDEFGNVSPVINHTWYVGHTCDFYVPYEKCCLYTTINETEAMPQTLTRSQSSAMMACFQQCAENGPCCGFHFHPDNSMCVTYKKGDVIHPLVVEQGWVMYGGSV